MAGYSVARHMTQRTLKLALLKVGNPDRKRAERGKRTLIRGGWKSIPHIVTLADSPDWLTRCDVSAKSRATCRCVQSDRN